VAPVFLVYPVRSLLVTDGRTDGRTDRQTAIDAHRNPPGIAAE